MISSLKLSRHDSDYLRDPTFYKPVVRALQYVTITRLEISFVGNKVCQLLSQPLEGHYAIVKRILGYLKGSLHRGLLLKPTFTLMLLSLKTFLGDDWGSYLNNKKFTNGSHIFLGLIQYYDGTRSNPQLQDAKQRQSIEVLWIQSPLQNFIFLAKTKNMIRIFSFSKKK